MTKNNDGKWQQRIWWCRCPNPLSLSWGSTISPLSFQTPNPPSPNFSPPFLSLSLFHRLQPSTGTERPPDMEDHADAGTGGNPRATCVVIGGQGFIGRFLVLRLLQLDNWIVRIADLSSSFDAHQQTPLLDAVSDGRASYDNVDVRDISQLIRAFEGSSAVFYVEATKASACDLYDCYKFIVQGAKNVINACRECKVKRLIYNSSADVVFGDESLRYPWKYEDALIEMKAQAEALILSANDYDGLLTCNPT